MRAGRGNAGTAAFLEKAPSQTPHEKHSDPRIHLIIAMRYPEWGVGSEKRVIAVNVPLRKGEVLAAQAVGCWKVVARMRGALWGSFPEFSNHEES